MVLTTHNFNMISYSNWIYFVHTRFLVFLSMFCGVVNNVQKDDKHGHLSRIGMKA